MATSVKLLKHQGLILQSPYTFPNIKFHFDIAGYGAGKTSGLVYGLLHTVSLLQGKKDAEGNFARIILASKNLTFLSKTAISNLEQALRKTNTEYRYDKKNNIITIGTVEIYLIPLEDPSTIYGYSVHNCWVDELSELSPPVCMEAIKALNERTRQTIQDFRDPFIVSVSSSQGLDGQYMAMEHFKRTGIGFVYIRGETRDNVFLKKADIDNLYKIYNDKERQVYLEGRFLSVKTSLVFSDYDPQSNMLNVDLYDSLDENDTVFIGQDFNMFGCAAVACVVKKGCVVIIKDYDIPDIRRAPEIFRYDFPTQKIVWIPDATSTAFYTQFKKELRMKNIRIAYRKSNPLVQDRVFAINKLMYAKRMFVTPICKAVEKTLLTHQFDPKTQAPMKGGKGAPDHIADSMGYAVYHIMCWEKELKDVYAVTLGRSRLTRLGSLGQEVDADYRLLSPDKITFEAPVNVNKDEWDKERNEKD